ncbi:hypothetical protein ACFV1L_22135 [Kitasatospora sp. NPDC059646]|uniref:hypothetical protein n=1 Tax=Kitasatospora sp. NPDC059646 TaxID=3346893 RepID=UPI00368EF632
MTTSPLPYADSRTEDLLPVLRRHLAAAAERHNLGPVPPTLDLWQANRLLETYAAQPVSDDIAGLHRQIKEASRELNLAVDSYGEGNTDVADELARAAVLYLDQVETTLAYLQQHNSDPINVVDDDVAEMGRLISEVLVPALGTEAPFKPGELYDIDDRFQEIRTSLVQLRRICVSSPQVLDSRVNATTVVHLRAHLSHAIDFLGSAHREAFFGVSEAASRIVYRIRTAAGHVARASALVQMEADQ